MPGSLWRDDDGWPYPDPGRDAAVEVRDLALEVDDDLANLTLGGARLYDRLDPLERTVLRARFGLDGATVRTMKELQHDLGVPRAALRDAMGSGLAKLRDALGG